MTNLANPTHQNVAVRVWPVRKDPKPSLPPQRRQWLRPPSSLAFHVITRDDGLLFGFYVYQDPGGPRWGLFYYEGLEEQDVNTLRSYALQNGMNFMSVDEFRKYFYERAYTAQCLVTGWNLPYQISQIAWRCGRTRAAPSKDGRPKVNIFKGGFSFALRWYADRETGEIKSDPFLPTIKIKCIGDGIPMIQFSGKSRLQRQREREEAAKKGLPPPENVPMPGNFLDAKTLSFALTGEKQSLASACRIFGVRYGRPASVTGGQLHNGPITVECIDMLVDDVRAITELTGKLLEEFERHPIRLEATRAYSPSSIAKAYLRDMRIPPILERQPDFSPTHLGYAMSAFYAGRAGVRIRRQYMPVAYLDFRSNYATVSTLMRLWDFIIADKIRVVDHVTSQIKEFVESILRDPSALFNPDVWPKMTAFVKVIPNDDPLPVRMQKKDGEWYSNVEHISGTSYDHALWYALPCVVATAILTGRMPHIVDAFKIEAEGVLPGLKPIKLRDEILVDPRTEPLYKIAVEERQRLKREDPDGAESKRLQRFLKIIVNVMSYGIWCEMNRDTEDRKIELTCYGKDGPYPCWTKFPEDPGEYCFPPLASLITSGARLLMAMLEQAVLSEGGVSRTAYVMEATDCMAPVSTPDGGLDGLPDSIPLALRESGIIPLSHVQVEAIRNSFSALNPFHPQKFPGSILGVKLNSLSRQIYCFAISVNKHAFYTLDESGQFRLVREDDGYSEHTLGNYLNPLDPDSPDKTWIAEYWDNGQLDFGDLPAVQAFTISSYHLFELLKTINKGKDYYDQIKPFSLLIKCTVLPRLNKPVASKYAHLMSTKPPEKRLPKSTFLLMPYSSDPRVWLDGLWLDSEGELFKITTDALGGEFDGDDRDSLIVVKSHGQVICDHAFTPESRYEGLAGNACDRSYTGVLLRKKSYILDVKPIGKETNDLGLAMIGMVREDEFYTYYNPESTDKIDDLNLLIETIKSRGLSLSRIAKLAGIDKACVRRFLAGKNVDRATVDKIKAAVPGAGIRGPIQSA
jgi:hypothetical protein